MLPQKYCWCQQQDGHNESKIAYFGKQTCLPINVHNVFDQMSANHGNHFAVPRSQGFNQHAYTMESSSLDATQIIIDWRTSRNVMMSNRVYLNSYWTKQAPLHKIDRHKWNQQTTLAAFPFQWGTAPPCSRSVTDVGKIMDAMYKQGKNRQRTNHGCCNRPPTILDCNLRLLYILTQKLSQRAGETSWLEEDQKQPTSRTKAFTNSSNST